MSALGQKQTSRHVRVMSVIPLKADIHRRGLHVRLVLKADPNFPETAQHQRLRPLDGTKWTRAAFGAQPRLGRRLDAPETDGEQILK